MATTNPQPPGPRAHGERDWADIPSAFIQAAHTAAVEAGYSGDPADPANVAFMRGYLLGEHVGFHRGHEAGWSDGFHYGHGASESARTPGVDYGMALERSLAEHYAEGDGGQQS